jgi:hypothetical protein
MSGEENLRDLNLKDLRHAWRSKLGREPPAFRSRDLLLRALIYELEIASHGDLKPTLKRRLTELAQSFGADDHFDPAPRKAVTLGSALVRDWNGARYVVLVAPGGFQYGDTIYPSLTHVARTITGKHQSGPRFFGLVGKAEREPRA